MTSAITSTLGSSPNPNQMIISGAMAMIGRVCEATSSGVSARRSHGEKSTAMASTQPSASDTANPTAVTCSVGTVFAQICSRNAQPCSTTRSGDGSTCGRTANAVTYHCHTASPMATSSSGGQARPSTRRIGERTGPVSARVGPAEPRGAADAAVPAVVVDVVTAWRGSRW